MMKKFVSTLILSTFIFSAGTTVTAQVTIGSLHKPSSGALLDLKNQLPDADNVTATSGGLLLPRVELQSLTDFSLLNLTLDEKNDHMGLLVYNLKVDDALSLEKGIYQWDGEMWRLLKKVTKTESVAIRKEIYQANEPDENKTLSLGLFEFRIRKNNGKYFPQFRLSTNVGKRTIYWHVNEYWDETPNRESANRQESGYSFSLIMKEIDSIQWSECMNSMSKDERNEVWLADLDNNHMYQIQFMIIENGSSSTFAMIAKRY
jgi:hypothetical protein